MNELFRVLSVLNEILVITYPAIVVDQLELIVRQNVHPLVHQVQSHLSSRETCLTPGPSSAHGEQGADVELLLS